MVEGEHREAVGSGERVDDAGRGTPRGDHLPTPHAAGTVKQQHDIARTLDSFRAGSRRQNGQLERGFEADR